MTAVLAAVRRSEGAGSSVPTQAESMLVSPYPSLPGHGVTASGAVGGPV